MKCSARAAIFLVFAAFVVAEVSKNRCLVLKTLRAAGAKFLWY
jgi:hypothetical protein